MIKKKTVKSVFVTLLAVVILAAIIIFFPNIVQFLWSIALIFVPFITAYAVSLFANNLASALQKRFHLPRNISAILVIILTIFLANLSST